MAARRRRQAHQLPPGRHGLAPSFVQADQRERILDAMAAVAREEGYHGATVPRVVKRAGVSHKTFYDFFGNREQGFLAAIDRLEVTPVAPRVLRSILTPFLGERLAGLVAERHEPALSNAQVQGHGEGS